MVNVIGAVVKKSPTASRAFVEPAIVTDEGVTGIGGPFNQGVAFIISKEIAPLLIDQDPIAIERIWDKVYRYMVHGRKGNDMIALSAVDCALWDLKGKWANAPVYRLLGGPIRTEIPAYASMLGFSLDPERIADWTTERIFVYCYKSIIVTANLELRTMNRADIRIHV